MTFDYTICIPVFTQPHFLSLTLEGLVKHSRLRARILVVDSDQSDTRPQDSPRQDFYRHPETRETYRAYKDVKDFFHVHSDWLARHHIEYYDATADFETWWAEFCGGQYGTPQKFQGGMDIAFKNNWVLPQVETEWVIPNWDADFYPMPDWDKHLLSLLDFCDDSRTALIPTHVQPVAMSALPDWKDYWVESRSVSGHRLCLPTLFSDCAFTDDKLVAFHIEHKRSNLILTESAGKRGILHWVPMAFRTTELRDLIGPWSYKGSGYDIEFDDRCGQVGIQKVSHGASWVYHKANIMTLPGTLHQQV
jgi:hypothetical protein